MHSRIYQITRLPLSIEEYLKEEDLFNYQFMRNIADSLNSDLEREKELMYFKETFEGIKLLTYEGDASFTLNQGGKEIYFKDTYREFIKNAKKVIEISFEQFIENELFVKNILNQLEENFSEQIGCYIFLEDELMPFDQFIRLASYGVKYYINGILDYHY